MVSSAAQDSGVIKTETRCWERTRPACFDLAQIRHAGRVRSQDKSDFNHPSSTGGHMNEWSAPVVLRVTWHSYGIIARLLKLILPGERNESTVHPRAGSRD